MVVIHTGPHHNHHNHHTQSFQLILCALLVAPLRGTQVVAIVMCDHDGAVSRSSARRRRERRLRAALRHEQLSIAMHLAQALHHSSGRRKHVDVVGSGEAFGPVLVSGLLEPSSGSAGPFKHLHVAAQLPVAGAAPLLGDDFWDQPLSLEKLKDLLPSPVSVPVTVPVVAASVPFFCPGSAIQSSLTARAWLSPPPFWPEPGPSPPLFRSGLAFFFAPFARGLAFPSFFICL